MIRSTYRAVVPLRMRIGLRRMLNEIPIRLGDWRADVSGGEGEPPPLPPARLRSRVGTDSSRAQFLAVGRMTAALVLELFEASRNEGETWRNWLDFGCGSGRIARHILSEERDVTGVDVDGDAVAWCAANLPGRFLRVEPVPPTMIESGSIDVLYCISVFTHLDEAPQFAWLEEVHRMLRPGGLFIVSTHPPALTYNRPDLTEADHRQLNETGFLFAQGTGAFNDDSAFHSEGYLRATWTKWFDLLEYRSGALGGVQDLTAWRCRGAVE